MQSDQETRPNKNMHKKHSAKIIKGIQKEIQPKRKDKKAMKNITCVGLWLVDMAHDLLAFWYFN